MERLHNWWWVIFLVTLVSIGGVRIYQMRRAHQQAEAKYGPEEGVFVPRQIVVPKEFPVVVEKDALGSVRYTYTLDMSGRHDVEQLFQKFKHSCPDLDLFLSGPFMGTGSYSITPDGACKKVLLLERENVKTIPSLKP